MAVHESRLMDDGKRGQIRSRGTVRKVEVVDRQGSDGTVADVWTRKKQRQRQKRSFAGFAKARKAAAIFLHIQSPPVLVRGLFFLFPT